MPDTTARRLMFQSLDDDRKIKTEVFYLAAEKKFQVVVSRGKTILKAKVNAPFPPSPLMDTVSEEVCCQVAGRLADALLKGLGKESS